ncbi:hypothetical protein [Caldifermentibacillus hisashii]|uniref:hypothetical protein n=1 Tax=Caldifermentibacillus hisashii TaxID=996558 RepID=UPI001C0FDE00|nr:hypothetical protein [Caldifermentibacillus hisashii]MBU5343592.1 hypothetical protein [Caldifermentibacillus hisashii]
MKAISSYLRFIKLTRLVLVVKIMLFSLQNGDENGVRRQKSEFFGSKWRRERGSSPK